MTSPSLSDQFWVIENSSDYQNNASGNGGLPPGSVSLSKESGAHTKRKRGRPKVKEVVLNVKRHIGRPRKERNSENDARPLPKRKVGRPPKIKGSGGVVVEFGPIVSN